MHKTWMLPQPKHRPSSLHAHCIGVGLVLLGAEAVVEKLLRAGDMDAVSVKTPGHSQKPRSLPGAGWTWCCWAHRACWKHCYTHDT